MNQFFGAIIIGPSGSGKSTLCNGIHDFFTQINRKHVIINLDPASEGLKYENCAINIQELINLDDAMNETKLGPNGGLVFCMEFLEKNIDWLLNKIQNFKDHYLIFDMPGQIELYMDTECMKKILKKIVKNDQFEGHLGCVELFEINNCYDPAKFISICFSALSSMINLDLPHLNVHRVLSKADMIQQFGKMPSRLRTYTNEFDLEEILLDLEVDSKKFSEKYMKLNQELTKCLKQYSLVSFYPMEVTDKTSMAYLIVQIDKMNGYFYELSVVQKDNENEIIRLHEEFQQEYIFSSSYINYLEEKYGIV